MNREEKIREVEFLAVGETCKATLWLTPDLTEGTLDSSGMSTQRALIKPNGGVAIATHNPRSYTDANCLLVYGIRVVKSIVIMKDDAL